MRLEKCLQYLSVEDMRSLPCLAHICNQILTIRLHLSRTSWALAPPGSQAVSECSNQTTSEVDLPAVDLREGCGLEQNSRIKPLCHTCTK